MVVLILAPSSLVEASSTLVALHWVRFAWKGPIYVIVYDCLASWRVPLREPSYLWRPIYSNYGGPARLGRANTDLVRGTFGLVEVTSDLVSDTGRQ